MCEYMRKIEEDFYMLSEESKEKIKRIVDLTSKLW